MNSGCSRILDIVVVQQARDARRRLGGRGFHRGERGNHSLAIIDGFYDFMDWLELSTSRLLTAA